MARRKHDRKGGRKGRQSRNRKIKPFYFIICEGETEENYINFIKAHFKVSAEVKSKVLGNNLSVAKVDRIIKALPDQPNKTYLFYDLDREDVKQKLFELTKHGYSLIYNNPSIEFWFLLHNRNQRAEIETKNAEKALQKEWPEYKKGFLSDAEREILLSNFHKAKERAVALDAFGNPSSNTYTLIEALIGEEV